MTKEVIILQHVPNEGAGTILDFLKEQGISHRSVPLYGKRAAFPSVDAVRALVVMGGPMNVYEEDQYPFLKEEDAFIRLAVRKKVPYLGICLGAQLLAKALGAKVYKAGAPEIGWGMVRLSAAAAKSPLFGGMARSDLRALQWHEDTFDLPEGASALAVGDVVPNQAYAVRGLFYGFQFHLEINRAMLEDWFAKRPELPAILGEYDAYAPRLRQITDRLYRNFFFRV
ncbi:MAG: type 1 glutamine amidotransferase [Candidatus Omnitrophica bacterium]|nr:type 1 glutamine amidotransferase [Candidatus Omnitrophota bacterium]